MAEKSGTKVKQVASLTAFSIKFLKNRRFWTQMPPFSIENYCSERAVDTIHAKLIYWNENSLIMTVAMLAKGLKPSNTSSKSAPDSHLLDMFYSMI